MEEYVSEIKILSEFEQTESLILDESKSVEERWINFEYLELVVDTSNKYRECFSSQAQLGEMNKRLKILNKKLLKL